MFVVTRLEKLRNGTFVGMKLLCFNIDPLKCMVLRPNDFKRTTSEKCAKLKRNCNATLAPEVDVGMPELPPAKKGRVT